MSGKLERWKTKRKVEETENEKFQRGEGMERWEGRVGVSGIECGDEEGDEKADAKGFASY